LIYPPAKAFLAVLLFFAACLPAACADPELKAGGTAVAVPGPAGDFVEAGDKLRAAFFELLVPSNNRLLSAYLQRKALTQTSEGNRTVLDVYAMVEVPRRAEYADCTPQAFEKVLKSTEAYMGKWSAKNTGELEQELNNHLKTLGAKPIEVGRPEMLGGIFRKSDAAGFAMLATSKVPGATDTMATGFGLLRVKQRLILAYLYRKYESPETVRWVRTNLESWCDAVLAKNR
jgi:hypothetical protein